MLLDVIMLSVVAPFLNTPDRDYYHEGGILKNFHDNFTVTIQLRDIMNSFTLVFHPFMNIHLYLVKFKNIWFICIQI